MIIPQNLAPFPLGPRDEDMPRSPYADGEDFVLKHDIYRVLLGASGGLPVEGLPAEDLDSFAGRGDVKITRTSPFIDVAGPQPVAAAPASPMALNPVFGDLAASRRAAPPRIVMDVERDFGTPQRGADRWWMLGVAVAVAAVTLCGTFVDFTSREAVRRAGMESHASRVATVPALIPAKPQQAAGEKTIPLVSSQAADAVR
jgi:hypothetical protein